MTKRPQWHNNDLVDIVNAYCATTAPTISDYAQHDVTPKANETVVAQRFRTLNAPILDTTTNEAYRLASLIAYTAKVGCRSVIRRKNIRANITQDSCANIAQHAMKIASAIRIDSIVQACMGA